MSLAWVHGSPHVEDLALPKSLKSGNFTPAKAVIRRMSVKLTSGAVPRAAKFRDGTLHDLGKSGAPRRRRLGHRGAGQLEPAGGALELRRGLRRAKHSIDVEERKNLYHWSQPWRERYCVLSKRIFKLGKNGERLRISLNALYGHSPKDAHL
jgi:hypothetical protein